MAMIKCPKCGANISDKAFYCPNCKEELIVNKSNNNIATDKQYQNNEVERDKAFIRVAANNFEESEQHDESSIIEQIDNRSKLEKDDVSADLNNENIFSDLPAESVPSLSDSGVQPIEIVPLQIKKPKKNIIKTMIVFVVGVIVLVGAIMGGVSLKHYIGDKNAANSVIDKINNIGEVTDANTETANKIYDASEAYNALSDKQKSYVVNVDVLTQANHQYEQKQAVAVLTGLAFFIKKNAGLCQAIFSDYANVWHNAIFRKTDKYNNGNFSDFNNALLAFQLSSTYTSAQSTLKSYNTTITTLWKETINSPSENQDLYNAVKAVYTAYQPMYDLAANPEGSYNSYTAETQRLNSAYKTAYAELTAVLPDVESY